MIICVSGKIGSGKTTLRKLLMEKLDFNGYSVSDYLKHIAKESGVDSNDRSVLQAIGKSCIQKGQQSFVSDFLQFVGEKEDIIIDGIRHIEFYKELVRQCKTTKIYLIALIVDPDERADRIKRRQGCYAKELSESSIAEGDFSKICQEADICVDTTNLTDIQTVNYIISKLDDTDALASMESIKRKIKLFNDKRGWSDHQNALNVAMSISIEANELLENFQWLDCENAHLRAIEDCENIKEELADIMIYCLNFATAYNYDVATLIFNKLRKNGIKYAEKDDV